MNLENIFLFGESTAFYLHISTWITQIVPALESLVAGVSRSFHTLGSPPSNSQPGCSGSLKTFTFHTGSGVDPIDTPWSACQISPPPNVRVLQCQECSDLQRPRKMPFASTGSLRKGGVHFDVGIDPELIQLDPSDFSCVEIVRIETTSWCFRDLFPYPLVIGDRCFIWLDLVPPHLSCSGFSSQTIPHELRISLPVST